MATLRVSAVTFGRVGKDDRRRRWIWKGMDVQPEILRSVYIEATNELLLSFLSLYFIEGSGVERKYIVR